MDVLKQPHDKFFRSTFGQVKVASDFLSNYLPKDLMNIIDMSTLEPQKESFLDENLKQEFSDLLFRVCINDKDSYIYLLFEHKSYRDRMVIFQVLKYMVNIWESKIQADKDKRKQAGEVNSGDIELPIILPLVVYHDKGEWNIKKTLGEMIPSYNELPENLKKYIPNFEYLLFDLSEFPKETVELQSEAMISIKALTRARHASREEAIEILEEAIDLIHKSKEKDEITYYISACIRYILSVRDDISKEEMHEIAGKISIEGGELVMTIAEKLREEGKELARKEEKESLAKNLLVMGDYSVAKIAMVSGLTEKEIKDIKKDINK